MKDGKCPKCNATTVYTRTKGIRFGNGGLYVDISSEFVSRSVKEVDYYICISCGYFETYLVDPGRLQAIAKAVRRARAGLKDPKDWEKVA